MRRHLPFPSAAFPRSDLFGGRERPQLCATLARLILEAKVARNSALKVKRL
jgi:hypothetical protein